jgi:hypothetical protein
MHNPAPHGYNKCIVCSQTKQQLNRWAYLKLIKVALLESNKESDGIRRVCRLDPCPVLQVAAAHYREYAAEGHKGSNNDGLFHAD